MHWRGTGPDGQPAGGEILADGLPPDKMASWLAGRGFTGVTFIMAPGDATHLDGASARPDDADRARRARPPAGAPPGGHLCTADLFSTTHPFEYTPSMDTDEARREWELCGRPANDEIHAPTGDDGQPHMPTRHPAAVTPPGAPTTLPVVDSREIAKQVDAMSVPQLHLLDEVTGRADVEGDDTRAVLSRIAATPADKAAVAECLGGPGAGREFLDRNERMATRAQEAERALEAYRDGEISHDEYVKRNRAIREADQQENTLEVQDRIADAYRKATKDPGDVVGVDKLRAAVDDVPKAVFDHAMWQLAGHPDVDFSPGGADSFYTGPNQAERAAAVRFGGQEHIRFRMGVDFPAADPANIANRIDTEGQQRGDADSILRRLDDGTIMDLARRLSVDVTDGPPPAVVRERIADLAASRWQARRAHDAAVIADGNALYEADGDLEDIDRWTVERRAALREVAQRRSNWDWLPGRERAQRILGALDRTEPQ